MIPNKFAKALVGAWKLTENFFMGLKCRHDIHQNTIFGAILEGKSLMGPKIAPKIMLW